MKAINGRMSMLAAAGVAAAAGSGLAVAPTAQAAVPATVTEPTVTESLVVPGVSADAQGNLAAAMPNGGALAVTVQFQADFPPPATTPPPGGVYFVAQVDCGVPGSPTSKWFQGAPGPMSVESTCDYTAPGTYPVTVTVSDSLANPTQSASVVRTVTVAPFTGVAVDRYDGASRYGTGIALSQAEFPAASSASAVVLARGDQFADALAGIPLAKAKNAPLLLTPGGVGVTALDPNVKNELLRVLPHDGSHTVFVLGGTAALPTPVTDEIAGLGYTVVRLAGGTRFDTALTIARDPRALNNPLHVVVARGDDFADALAAGPLASNAFQDSKGSPAAILLSNGPKGSGTMDPATADYVRSRLNAPADRGAEETSTWLMGNVATVGGGAEDAMYRACVQTNAGSPCTGPAPWGSFTGQDRFETARLVAMLEWTARPPARPYTFSAPRVGVATGLSFADALTGGAYMALKDGPLLLTGDGSLNPSAAAALQADAANGAIVSVAVFGGSSVLPPTVQAGIATAVAPAAIIYTDHRVMF